MTVSKSDILKELAKRELASRSLLDFIRYNFTDYKVNWHHRAIIEALEAVERGETKRLMVFMPPQHGKSEICSIQFPAWYLGRHPERDIIAVSYSAELAIDFGKQTRNLVKSWPYKHVFQNVKLAEDSTAAGKWNTNKGGAYVATGVGGAITGRGADVLLIDDPVKNRAEAESELIREATWDWYKSTARTRLRPGGAIIVIQTRWNDEDLSGKILKNGEEWTVLSFPAVATHDETYRKEGEALWPERYSLAELMNVKKDAGSYNWASLYQQDPINQESQEFKQEFFQYARPEGVVRKFATLDTALSKREEADFTGVTKNYVDTQNNWYLSSKQYKINSKGIIDLIFQLHHEGFEKIGIEEGAFTQAVEPFLRDEMIKRNTFPVVETLKHHQIQKETRIRGLIPRYEAKTIFHIPGECEDLEKELLRFPKGSHDDCADSLAYQLQIANPPFIFGRENEYNLWGGQSYT